MLTLDRVFTFRQRKIRYGVIGEGRPLVLIHGTPFSSQVWRRIAPHLARGRKIYFFDLLGYGQSDKSAGDVSLGIQNDVLAALFQHWGLEAPDVLAHDFGGATALRGWAINRLRYNSLMLMDAVALRPWGSPLVQHVRDHQDAFAGMPAYMHEAVLRVYIQGAAHRTMRSEDLEVHVSPWTGGEGQAAFYRQIAQMDLSFTEQIESRLTEIPFPVQVVWGECDEWLPLDQGRRLASMISKAPLVTIPDAGHLVQEDAPEAVLSLAEEFFGRG